LYKKFIGILYERYTKTIYDDVIIQGLIGRMNGYDDNGDSICFTNIESIKKYEKLWISEWRDNTVNWKSNSTKTKNGKTCSKGNTYNNPKHVQGLIDKSESIKQPCIIKEFKSQQEARQYCKTVLKNKKGPRNKNPNKNGYYTNTFRSKTKVYTYDEIMSDMQGLGNTNYRFHACYTDKNNKETLLFLVIHHSSVISDTLNTKL